ncbi:hypothetical protein FOMA001_g9149 [Fusarium oxysporum f. sp. matthiolae]|nr:hypothetical protein FOMA001_g9149 [Fusarium oxysporum f. sp. matthiolae]
MPFYPELAASFIDEVTKYIQWQSTLEALKNPPGDIHIVPDRHLRRP